MTEPVKHLCEKLLGLPRDYLRQNGEWSLQFNPAWPGQGFLGVEFWNVTLAIVAVLLVVYVYTRDGRSTPLRIVLGLLRGSLLALIIFLLNRPVLTLGQTNTEPSVLAVLIDDSGSMRVPDAGPDGKPVSRLAAVQNYLTADQGKVLKDLSKNHNIRFYRFDRTAMPMSGVEAPPAGSKLAVDVAPAIKSISALGPDGESTQVLPSILNVCQDLQGQAIAGMVLFTDGRDTPARKSAEGLDALKNYGVKLYPVAVGSDSEPKNIEVQNMQVEESAFKGDVLNIKGTVKVTGFEPNHPVTLVLKDKATGTVLKDPSGVDCRKVVRFPDDKPLLVEMQWKTADPGNKDVVLEAEVPEKKVLLDDNGLTQSAMVSVRDTQVNVLYVDGYPRWEYRYLKTEMIRERSVNVSCLLASADANFIQEGTDRTEKDGKKINMRISKFPDSLTALNNYDVLVIGDVDPRYFTDAQLQIISEYVSLGRGFEMIAGPKFSPQAYHNTPIEQLLPVTINKVLATDSSTPITGGFRPVVTKTGTTTSIFRFEPDAQKNEEYLKDEIPLLFWYCRGVMAKPSVGEVLAEHPTDIGLDGHKAPILVAGRFGGRTLFSAIDESWRWRYYTGESNFDKYWVQQIRYLARNSNIDQGHQLNLSTDQQTYQLGQHVRLTLRVLDPSLTRQLPDQISVNIVDSANQPVRNDVLIRQDGSQGLTYLSSFTADKVGKFTAILAPVASQVSALKVPINVMLPQLELDDPTVDKISLARLASETLGKPLDLSDATATLESIPSAKKVLPITNGRPLWDAPVVIGLFMLIIGIEWIVRKMFGMV